MIWWESVEPYGAKALPKWYLFKKNLSNACPISAPTWTKWTLLLAAIAIPRKKKKEKKIPFPSSLFSLLSLFINLLLKDMVKGFHLSYLPLVHLFPVNKIPLVFNYTKVQMRLYQKEKKSLSGSLLPDNQIPWILYPWLSTTLSQNWLLHFSTTFYPFYPPHETFGLL